MLVGEMRKKVKSVYNNSTWSARVDRMADNQVIAIFYSMEEKGRFKKKRHTLDQISLFDYMEEVS